MDEYLSKHHEIQAAVIGCVSYWQQNHDHQQDDKNVGVATKLNGKSSCSDSHQSFVDVSQGKEPYLRPYLHEQCSVLQVESNDEENSLSTSYTTTIGSLYKLPPDVSFEIVTLRHFDTITYEGQFKSQTRAASVQLKTKKHQSQKSSASGFLVLLLDRSSHWRCISATFAVSYDDDASRRNPTCLVRPTDMKDVMSCVWDGYCTANRACDGIKMAEVFHETCRLTYVDVSSKSATDHSDDGIRIWDSKRFCQKVTNRYISEPPHIPYAHLQNDQLAASGDELLGIEFTEGSPCVAMITLKVGHPPFLWTDLLTCAKLGTKWYIVHKSSTSEPFLTHLSSTTSNK